MRVGIIGLGRMGEGISRRMLNFGIEVWAYRRDYKEANKSYEMGYVSGITTSIENLVKVVKKSNTPAIYQLVVPEENVDNALDELLPFISSGDIIIDYGNSNFKETRKRSKKLLKLGVEFIDCGIIGSVYGFERGYYLMLGGSEDAVSTASFIFDALSPKTESTYKTNSNLIPSENGWMYCGPSGAGHFSKMVNNKNEYGVIQAYFR